MCKTKTDRPTIKPSISETPAQKVVESAKLKNWIEINGQRYNIENFRKKHPGGHVISFYDGMDATDAFFNFHKPEVLAKYSHLKVERTEGESAIPVPAVVKEYRELQARAKEEGLFKPRVWFFVKEAVIALFFWVLTFPLFMHGYWWLSIVSASTAQVCLGWLMHDLGHRAVTGAIKRDSHWNTIVMQFFQGGSSNWWTSKHNRHHLLPNVLDHDPDIHTDPLFVWSKMMKGGVWNKLQAFYFPILGPPLGIVFMNILVVRYSIRHREWTTLACILGFSAVWMAYFGPLHMFLMRIGQGLWFQWVVAVNHFAEEVHDKATAESLNWVQLVADTTSNVTGNWFMNWFTGHLNYQIEHHLFPQMPRCNYPLVADASRRLFEKHGLRYGSHSPWQATKRLFRSLQEHGNEAR